MSRSLERFWLLAAIMLTAGFCLIAFGILRDATDPSWQDTSAFLGHALYLRDHGGWLGFLREAFAGTYPITERHPLYMLLLQPFAAQEARFFWQAKLLNLAIGAITLVSFLWMLRRRYGAGVSLIGGALYVLSQSLLIPSSHVSAEPLLILCVLWTWWWLTSGASLRHWMLGGLWAGLSFLAKPSGTVITAGVVAASLWHSRGRALRSRSLWAFLAVALLIASPLLVRNVRRHSSLLYEGVNSHSLWLDHWKELGNEPSVISEDRYAIMEIERDELPTAMSYLKTHTPVRMAKRLLGGLIPETRVTLRALAPPALVSSDEVEFLAYIWGAAVVLLGAMGLWRRRTEWEGKLLRVWAGIFVPLFAWYSRVVLDPRFLAPLVPFVMLGAGLTGWALARRGRSPLQAVALAAFLVVPVGGLEVLRAARGLRHPRPISRTSSL